MLINGSFGFEGRFDGRDSRSNNRKFDGRDSRNADCCNSLEDVSEALAREGLKSSNLIIGIDFTKRNTASVSTHDQDVFSFYPDDRVCHGFEEVLSRYMEIAPKICLSGPTSFASIIEMATTIVEQSGGKYHVLVIIADGQVERSGPKKQRTVDVIVQTSKFPLSIILVGIGDGPWDMMRELDDNIPARAFDNIQFVNFTEIMAKNVPQIRKETEFALAALMKIPSQYKAIKELTILGCRQDKSPRRVALPPPAILPYAFGNPDPSVSFKNTAPAHYDAILGSASTAPSAPIISENVCICLTEPKKMAFGCGHQTCTECGPTLQECTICRSPIETLTNSKIHRFFPFLSTQKKCPV